MIETLGYVVRFRFLSILLFSLLVSPLYAASFDCNKATTETEKAICADPELSALDDLMAEVYKSAPDYIGYLTEVEIRKSQVEWLKNRNACDGERECIFRSYTERLRGLSKSFNSFLFDRNFTTYIYMGEPENAECPSNTVLSDRGHCVEWVPGTSSLRGTSVNKNLAFRFTYFGSNGHVCNMAGKAISEDNLWIFREDLCELKLKMGLNGLVMETNGECGFYYCGVRAEGALDTEFPLHGTDF